MRLTPGADLGGDPDTDYNGRYGRSIIWTCTACSNLISDRGIECGPADDAHGHDPDCARHARAIQAWEAEWEAGQ